MFLGLFLIFAGLALLFAPADGPKSMVRSFVATPTGARLALQIKAIMQEIFDAAEAAMPLTVQGQITKKVLDEVEERVLGGN